MDVGGQLWVLAALPLERGFLRLLNRRLAGPHSQDQETRAFVISFHGDETRWIGSFEERGLGPKQIPG
jgi:hypothetical protein